jgi:site-specific DNA recombinase
MMRVALYARYSSDNQRAASIDDQLRQAREYASRQGWVVAVEFSDAAVSGATLLRPGLQALLRAALSGDVDVALAESLDRFSRDQEDTAALFKRLSFVGVRLVTVSEGDIGHLHVGLKGTMNALYLQDLAQKTRRGLRGRVEAGSSGGGICFGYRMVPGDVRGGRVVDDAQAAVVRRIFAEFIAGDSPKQIARRLNAERVAGPTSGPWSPSTIHGHVRRGTGILNNELYIGRLVWNRLRYIKDPSTGRRVSRLNPSTDWVIADVPHLRIVNDELWRAAKARQAAVRRVIASSGLVRARRPEYLFSNLIRCAECGGGYTLITRGRMGCFNARSRGTCSNRRQIGRFEVEQRVLTAMTERFLEPKAFAAFCRGYADVMEARRKDFVGAVAGMRRELAAVDRGIREIVETVKGGYRGKAMLDELVALEAKKARLEAAISMPAPPALHPAMADVFREKVTALRAALEANEQPTDAREMLRGLVERILVPADGWLRVEGNLGAMLELAAGKKLPSIINNGVSYVGCGGSHPSWLTSLCVVAA